MKRLAILGMVTSLGLILIGTSWSQSPQVPAVAPVPAIAPVAPVAPVPPVALGLPPGADSTVILEDSDEGPATIRVRKERHTRGDVRSQLRKAEAIAKELREANDAKSPDEKKQADLKKKLEDAVAKIFDTDMMEREQRLAKLEERLKNLRAQLDRRKKAKSEIVDLEVKVLTNEAAGLGFSSHGQFDFGSDPISIDHRYIQRWGEAFSPKAKPDNRD
jgi:hypothetical protein